MFEGLELADEASSNGTGTLHTWRAVGQKKPCQNALPARALDPMWDLQMPLCISANSSSPSSRGMHFSFTPFGLLLYRTSSMNWYKVD